MHTIKFRATEHPRVPEPKSKHFNVELRFKSKLGRRRHFISLRFKLTPVSANLLNVNNFWLSFTVIDFFFAQNTSSLNLHKLKKEQICFKTRKKIQFILLWIHTACQRRTSRYIFSLFIWLPSNPLCILNVNIVGRQFDCKQYTRIE